LSHSIIAISLVRFEVWRALCPFGAHTRRKDNLSGRVRPQVEAGGVLLPGHFDEPRVTATSTSCPLRQVVRYTVVPGANFDIVVAKSFQLLSGNPLIAVTTSPVWIPARAAGLSGSGRSKIAPYGFAIPRLAAKGAVIGRTWTPKNEHSSDTFCPCIIAFAVVVGTAVRIAAPATTIIIRFIGTFALR
jgi:hypothetical protein